MGCLLAMSYTLLAARASGMSGQEVNMAGHLANLLTLARARELLSLKEIAAKCGVSEGTVSRWCTGATMPSGDRPTLLAHALRIPVDELNRAIQRDYRDQSPGLSIPLRLPKPGTQARDVLEVLWQLHHEGRPGTVESVAAVLDWPRGTARGALAQLEARGIAERSHDGKRVAYDLTRLGAEAMTTVDTRGEV